MRPAVVRGKVVEGTKVDGLLVGELDELAYPWRPVVVDVEQDLLRLLRVFREVPVDGTSSSLGRRRGRLGRPRR